MLSLFLGGPTTQTFRPSPNPRRSLIPGAADRYTPSPDVGRQARTSVLATAARPQVSRLGSLLQSLDNLANAVSFTVCGLQYTAEEAIAGTASLLGKSISLGLAHPEHQLDRQPVPEIDRPVVIVPGYTSQLSNYAPLVSHLTRDGANGGQTYYVKQGQFYVLGADNQLQRLETPPLQGKVFEMIFSDTHQSPQANLPEVRQDFDAIANATGVQRVDTIAHSMGGLDTRLYLDQGGAHVNRFMMVGTPNHGLVLADLALGVVNSKTGWAEKLGDLSDDDKAALEAQRVEANNSFLQELNSRWAAQQSQATAVQTEANGLEPTPAPGLLGTPHDTWGDGMQPTSTVALPNVTNKVHYQNLAHGDLMFGSTAIYADMNTFFDWTRRS